MCAVFGDPAETNLDKLNCSDETHYHMTRTEAAEMVKEDAAVWIREPGLGGRGVICFTNAKRAFRGLSCRVGATLAVAVEQREEWAQVMREDIAA